VANVNTLTATGVIPRLLVNALPILRESSFLSKLVNRKLETTPGAQYSTIDIPIASAIVAQDVAPSNIPPDNAGATPTSVPVSVNTWKDASFFLSDKDCMQIANVPGFIPLMAQAAVRALANAVTASIWALAPQIPTAVGTNGTTPFATDLTAAVLARKALNKQLAPKNNRDIVLNSDAMGNALLLRSIQDQSWRANAGAIVEGTVARTLGFDWFEDETNVPSHTNGTITTGLIAKAATVVAAALKTFVATTAASTGAAALKNGDVLAIAGHSQTYTLTADATQASAATDVTLAFTPGLQLALAGSEAITLIGGAGAGVLNMAFQEDAIALVSRPFVGADPMNLGNFDSITDEQSGLVLRLEVSRQYKRTNWSFDILWGVALPMPQYAVRILG
jgi:hypothetical protein